jgi:predicted cupin superfamily sugar epimerase
MFYHPLQIYYFPFIFGCVLHIVAPMKNADFWIHQLKLEPHPEGGYYRETYRSPETIPRKGLPERYAGPRSFSSSIYFLLRSTNVSLFHRLKSDEIWIYHEGAELRIHMLCERQGYSEQRLGPCSSGQAQFQCLIPAGTWLAAEVMEQDSYVLASCFVSPGFCFEDFELGNRSRMLKNFPGHENIIRRLTPEP